MRNTTVLIVDDDVAFADLAADLLTERGYDVVGQATTAGAAVAACERLDPDAVLLDVRLPDGSGMALAQTLRAGGDRPNVLLTSNDRMAIGPQHVERSAAHGFVPKTELARTDLDVFLRRR